MLGLFIASMYTTYFDIIVPNSLIGLIFSIMIVYLIAALFKFILNFLTTIVTNSLNKTIDAVLNCRIFSRRYLESQQPL